MHHAWNDEEVCRLIFEWCEPRSLALLARCAKALTDLATDELWSRLYSFEPFLCCLPSDLRTRQLEVGDLQRLDFYSRKVRVIHLEGKHINDVIELPGDFVSNHHNRKKQRRSEGHCGGKSWAEVWTEIGKLRSNIAFLPNLRRVRFSAIVEEMLLPLLGISGTNLEYVYIKHIHNMPRGWPVLVHDFLDQLSDTPKLEELYVRGGEPALIPLKVLRNSPLKNLRTIPGHLRGGPDSLRTLRPDIFQLSTLQHLSIGLVGRWNTFDFLPADQNDLLNPEEPSLVESSGQVNAGPVVTQLLHSTGTLVQDQRYLPALRELWLDLTNITSLRSDAHSAVNFFTKLDRPRLEVLGIRFREDINGDVLKAVIQAARENCHLQDLRELRLTGGAVLTSYCIHCAFGSAVSHYEHRCYGNAVPIPTPHEFREALRALLPLPNLKILQLNVVPDLLDILDLKMYKEIAAGMPGLESLRIGDGTFAPRKVREQITFSERIQLHYLAAFCRWFPKLHYVEAGGVVGMMLNNESLADACCPQVKTLRVDSWMQNDGRPEEDRFSQLQEEKIRALKAYFPNVDVEKARYSYPQVGSRWI